MYYTIIMNSKESILNTTPNNPQPTGWENVAEMADKSASFEQATMEGRAKMRALDEKYRKNSKSDFRMCFEGFQARCHEKSAECINAAVERTSTLAEEDDPEISVIRHCGRASITGGRYTRDSIGKFGTGEYILETLGSRSTPENIGRLQLIMRTIPSSNYARYESTRIDAERIEGTVIHGRSFIHDCAPEAHRLIEAMIDYHDSKDNPELLEQKKKDLMDTLLELRSKYGAGYKDDHENYMFNLDRYDSSPTNINGRKYGSSVGSDKELSDTVYNGDRGDINVIDILRNLKKNMEPVPLEAPKTKIPELNEAFERLGQIPVDERTGELQIELSDLKDVLNAMNKHLIENQGKRTLFPSTITAVAFTDRLSATVLRSLPKKDWQEIAFDPTFKEMLRFAQLTMSGEYNDDEFESFYSGFTKKAGEAFKEDGIDSEVVSEAFKLVQSRSLKNAQTVASSFSHEPGQEYLASAVWSGNLTHELIGLPEKQ